LNVEEFAKLDRVPVRVKFCWRMVSRSIYAKYRIMALFLSPKIH